MRKRFNISSRIATSPDKPEPGLDGLASRMVDWIANLALGMNRQAGQIRFQILVFSFLVLWVLLAFINHPIQDWQQGVLAVFNPAGFPEIQDPPLHLVRLLFGAFFSPDVLGHLLALIIPFYLALRLASIFLDDIYELKDVSIASRFITQAAFVYPAFGLIQIENGDVRQADRKSPIFNIGGPGLVRVSLENVAIFEKIDGEPELIGPTADNPWFIRGIDGFERLRQVIDVRDLTISIGDLHGRTKDGIPIAVQNIRLLFSVKRDTAYTTLTRPYPYDPASIMKLVYEQGKGPWTNSITSLVRGELITFISEHTLGEIFAAVGDPEVNRQIERQSLVQRHIWQHRKRSRRYRVLNQVLAQSAQSRLVRKGSVGSFPQRLYPRFATNVMVRPRRRPVKMSEPQRWGTAVVPTTSRRIHYPQRPTHWKKPVSLPFRRPEDKFPHKPRYPLLFRPELLQNFTAPNFVPRPQLSRRFYEEFARSFPERASTRGVRLEWIDVGTWHTPSGIILGQHLDALRLTAQNSVKGDRAVLDNLRQTGQATELVRLMRRPILRFLELRRQESNPEDSTYGLIEEYLSMLRSARDEFLSDGIPLPDRLLPAIDHIQRYQRNYIRRQNRARYL